MKMKTNEAGQITNVDAPMLPQQGSIRPAKIYTLQVGIKGKYGSPLVQHAFSAKARQKMAADQAAGSAATKNTGRGKGRAKEPKDFGQLFIEAAHRSTDGWYGIPAPAFRAAMISACRVAGFAMTAAKLSIFVVADGIDAGDRSPLVRLIADDPLPFEAAVRNATGVIDIRLRPAWDQWKAILNIQFDADQFQVQDVLNLLLRAGLQVGIGEGRPDSKKSAGQGWGMFELDPDQEVTVSEHKIALPRIALAAA